MQKRYLGDGVYIERRWDDLVLTTEDGARVTNSVVLEPEVYRALLSYVERTREERADGEHEFGGEA